MAQVATLNAHAAQTLERILALIPEGESYVKIDNNAAFMPLAVEKGILDLDDIISLMDDGREKFALSLAHYGTCNGDAMTDPEVVILCYKTEKGWQYAPATYQNDYMGLYQRDISTRDGRIVFSQQAQKELCEFCEMWLHNIAFQQGI